MPGPPVAHLIEGFRTAHAGSPILVCSGHLEEEVTRRRVREGAYGFLAKPFSGSQLVDKVRELLREVETMPAAN